MSVPSQIPYNIYTANGMTTVFTFQFYIISAGDLEVSINGSVISSGYTISGVGNKDGGDITFLTPPANGAVVMLERVVPTYRLTDYQDNGDLLADTVNKDFDRIWMAIQRAFIDLGLAITRPLSGGPYNAQGYRIENLLDPVYGTDAATAKWVEALAGGSIEGTLRADLARADGATHVGYRDTNVYTALDRLYRSVNGVVIMPQWQPVAGSATIKFTGGLYSFNGIGVLGAEQNITSSLSTICIVVKSDGTYEPRDRYPFDGAITIAHVKSGSLVELIGTGNKSAFGIAGCPASIPWLPGELRRIEEQIPIYCALRSDGTLRYWTDYDVAVKKASSGTTYYVDCTNGSDTTGDGTQTKPFQRIKYAIEKTPAARTIMIKGGMEYTRDFTWNVSVVDRELDFIGYDGTPILSTVEPAAMWTAQGSAGVYQYTGSLVLNVVDYANLDSYGHAMVLTSAASLAACISTPGSSYKTGNTLYIHLFDGREPDANARLVLQLTNGRIQDNSKVYIENIHFRDSFRGFQAEVQTAGKKGYLYAKNCIFDLSVTSNAFNSLGVNCIMQSCTAQYGMQDAFNYHADQNGLGIKPWFIEIDCIGRWGGFDNLPNNNGSTAHDGSVGVRIGGEYYGTFGRVVHDVHDGTVTANFDCYAHDSSRDDFIGGACFTAGQGSDTTGKAKVYLFGCRHSGPNASITKDGLSEVWLFDTPIGANAQYTIGNPYSFIH
ncbi:phage tail fiber protein [Klebsiella pneumoniae]|uniref:phage tail fiber domain-containing protein n=1 Tax=Klebsiella pneumoniae TaxID=573 RepID=UPI002271007E|nr:phage tail fiber protein [Klebsiella pneumoniae]MCY0445412.1 phage tail fiber protein [Klebsiella pneumoniae]MDQ5766276.1 phage tail fiber protein [Klebsiella pneumoniae]